MSTTELSLKDLLIEWRDDRSPDIPEQQRGVALLEAVERERETDDGIDSKLGRMFLNLTYHPRYLQSLSDRELRYRWAKAADRIIENISYTLGDMFEDRVAAHPDKTLFQDMSKSQPGYWSYRVIRERLRAMAAVFFNSHTEPRVAIYCHNSVESACVDLACLCHDILDTPLNIHFDVDTTAWIFDQLKINIVVVDTEEHLLKLMEVRKKTANQFTIFSIESTSACDEQEACLLQKASLDLTHVQIENILQSRRRMRMSEVCTVMFTSGSTGKPKGVSFSQFNLVSKRFSRGAALPEVGDDEVLLCYLPLYHTFGRYFELLGSIYWSGTYVIPGNPSVETLLNLLTQVNPTGLISIPLRWQQIADACHENSQTAMTAEEKTAAFRQIVGRRLHWGLSAAGYLGPDTFRYFNHNGVNLCSGFGMTEATGGITMTPPGEYRDNSIGRPLPNVDVRLTEVGEMEIAGSYIARYLDDMGPGDDIPIDFKTDDRYWLPTGDLFRLHDDGHYEIIDRLKDIYKNNKGQTIAPRRVEKLFEGVSGIKRTFLVGDARAYNVLLIVPDTDDLVFQGISSEAGIREYFHQIVSNANQDLAPYERVVNFASIDRDFTIDKAELTPKGSYRRKNIEKNFVEVIDELYTRPFVEMNGNGFTARIPRWFYRDIGTLEDGIRLTDEGLHDNRRDLTVALGPTDEDGYMRIGDLMYQMEGKVIDFGLLTRQPMLWMGNPQLIAFCPCRMGWDLDTAPFTSHVRLPVDIGSNNTHRFSDRSRLLHINDQTLAVTNQTVISALYGNVETAKQAIRQLGKSLAETDERVAAVVRRRIQALAYHSEFRIRALAYYTLLLDEPSPDYNRTLPAFIESGLPFLDEDAIREIASADLKKRRLEALRRRLFTYRTQLQWPASDVIRQQFVSILKLLKDFAQFHPEFYDTVRAELAGWILHKSDPDIAKQAEEYFTELYRFYEERLTEMMPAYSDDDWTSRVIFGDELTAGERKRLREVLFGTTFLAQSIILAFDEDWFDLKKIPAGGIWISRIISRRTYLRYRISINTVTGKHYDLQIILDEDLQESHVLETIYWLMTISSYPYGHRVLPRLGCARLELKARSLAYLGDLTVWEKVREFAARRQPQTSRPRRHAWRKLFIRALAAFFRGWHLSGQRIIPGAITPDNIVVPEQDFREGAVIQSLTGWRPYAGALSIVRPMVQNFFRKTLAHYPWCADLISTSWIFDACIEELGIENGRKFLDDLHDEAALTESDDSKGWFIENLERYMKRLESEYYVPMALQNAIDRYAEWHTENPNATPEAKEQIISELWRLYRLDRFPEIARYYLYRHTYFETAAENVKKAFDRLLHRMHTKPKTPAIQMIELSELQEVLEHPADRSIFSILIFPRMEKRRPLEIRAAGESEHKYVIVSTAITDNQGEEYILREPTKPIEIGQLYRLFYREGYPKTAAERDRFLLVIDSLDQVVGGLCYRRDGHDVVHLDGTVIMAPLMGRGIGSVMLEDFCTRMRNQGIRVIKTHFFLRRFYTKHGFSVDSRWGALVRFLRPEDAAEAADVDRKFT